MKRSTSTALFCVASLIAAQAGAQSLGAESSPYSAATLSTCADDDCRPQTTGPLPPPFLETSERARAIARRLDGTGYYSRYSRALKG